MIARALVLALSCACALALAPLTAPTDDDCALYLTGPGRSSAYDYSLNLLKGNFGYEGQHTCITYEAINQAYLDARNRILVSQPKGDWKAEDFASVGELVLDISINLARTYGLTYEEIEKGLPLIDTSRTLIREVCPPVFSHVECRAGKYRRLDGLCNNLRHPTWGATMAPFQRLIGPLFADGINAPRIAHNGHDLPLSRVVSRTMHPDEGFHDHAGTVMVIAWGQFMDHDYTLTGTPLDPINRNDPEECCKRPLHLKHPYCNEIRVPDDDYFYRLWGVKCIDFVRGFPSPRPGCRLGSRVPFNTLTGAIDGNTVYGVTEKFARKLRTGYGGLLRMNPVFKEYGLKDLLPLKLDIPDEGCTRPNKNMYCFEAGEIRVNEQLVLTVMHTLMAREHNRVAEGLAAVNPHWDDETLYQEARRINIAEIQHITYNEFLPILLGKDVMEKFGLVLEKEGYWNGYDPEVNPDVLASFAAAAYRFGHSLLPTAVERWSKAHKFIASKRLSDLIRRPYDLYRAGVLDEYVMGLMNQVAQAMDDSITQEVTNHLFKKIGARFGMDLVSFNMQRGREFGLPGYMEFRKFCGLSGAETFQDLFGSMANETVRKYETIFEHPIDVDLWSGGVSERPLPGSMLGPTFACIIATQFSYSRRGDRFWFELPNQPSSFTPEQLAEIRKSRLARVICDNTDIIDTVQLYPMVLPDHELNPRVPCRSGIIPSMDFSKWAEPVPFHGAAKQFITDAIAATPNTVSCGDTTRTNNSTKVDTNGILCKAQNTTTSVITDNVTSKLNRSLELSSNSTIENCDAAENATKICGKDQPKINLTKKKDSIPKYLYKTSSMSSVTHKSKGHSKNSLKRKRRSLETNPNLDSNSANPVSIDYTTLHDVEQIERTTSPQVIKKEDLANFNIETLHEDIPTKNDKERNHDEPHVENYNLKHSQKNKEDDESKELHIDQQEGSNKESSENSSKESVESDESSFESKPKRPSLSYIQNTDDSKKYSDEISTQKDKESNESGTLDPSYNSYKDNKEVSSDEDKDHSYGKTISNEDGDLIRNSKSDNRNSKDNEDHFYGKVAFNDNTGPFFKSNKEIAEVNSKLDKDYAYGKTNSNEDNGHFSNPNKDIREFDKELDKINSNGKTSSNEENGSFLNPHKNIRKVNSKLDKDYLHRKTNSDEDFGPFIDSNRDSKRIKGKINLDEDTPLDSPNKFVQEKHSKEDKDYSYERPNSKEDTDSFYSPKNDNREINSKQNRRNLHGQDNSKEDNKSVENSSEHNVSDKLKTEKIHDRYQEKPTATITPKIFPNVDLDNFDKERIHVNNNSQFVPSKEIDIHNYSEEQIESTTVHPKTAKSGLIFVPINEDSSSVEHLSKTSEEPININDGEVKPVVELNSEDESSESSEENSTELQNGHLKTLTDNDNISKEEQINTKAATEKFIPEKGNDSEKGNVKQQFERIPLDYKHDDEKNTQTETKNKNYASSKDNKEENINDGTLDALTPKLNKRYDDNLNIKFDNIAIKLPEINLPDDILSYAYIGRPEKEKKKEDKKTFYHFGYDDSAENSEEQKKSVADVNKNQGYFNLYNNDKSTDHEDYKSSIKHNDDDDDENEDLYEKFVRERFGKKSSFGKRSEKLQATERNLSNPKLLETIQNILKKTENIQKEAEKSGDPKAGYMWTLEYGENL